MFIIPLKYSFLGALAVFGSVVRKWPSLSDFLSAAFPKWEMVCSCCSLTRTSILNDEPETESLISRGTNALKQLYF